MAVPGRGEEGGVDLTPWDSCRREGELHSSSLAGYSSICQGPTHHQTCPVAACHSSDLNEDNRLALNFV